MPDQGHRERRRSCRPRRSAASPCTSCWRRCRASRAPTASRTSRAIARQPRPQLPAPAQPALEPGEPRATPARLQRRHRRADRQGHLPRGPRVRRRRLHATPGARATRPLLEADARRARVSAAPTSARCWPARSWGRRRADGAPRQEDDRRPGQAAHLHRDHHGGDRPPGGHDRQHLLRGDQGVQGRSSPTPPAWSRATTSGSPASRSAPSRTSRSSTRPGALVTFTVEESTQLNESTHASIRYRNLVGQRYISLTQEAGDDRRARGRRHDPGRAHLAGARPDRAVQRLQAAVRGTLARRHQQAVLRDRPGLPGRGRHAREPPRPHRARSPRPWPTATP